MEIVCDVQENTAANLPTDVATKLKTLRNRMQTELVYTSELVQTLHAFQLTHQQILEQVMKHWLRGTPPTKLRSILSFLLEHHTSITRGDMPIPLQSPFRKIPFT
jgi:hypothetical protein